MNDLITKANNLLMTKKPITDKALLIKKLRSESRRMKEAERDERSRWNNSMGDLYAGKVKSCDEMVELLKE